MSSAMTTTPQTERRRTRSWAAAALMALLSVVSAPVATAEEADPWPNIRFFERVDPHSFTVPDADGVWFTAPTGQNCGIWGRGSFACSGDIPGAPPGTQAIGWVTGDRAMHYDWTVAWRLPRTPAQKPLPARTLIEHQGSTCAVTEDARTYCERGPLRFVMTPTGTWLTPIWMDLPR